MQAMKYQVLSQGFHVMSTNWGKVSVGLFLIRIIGQVKNQRRGMYALLIIMTAINVGGVATIYAQCSPVDYIWDRRLPGSCWPEGAQKKYAFFQGCTFQVPLRDKLMSSCLGLYGSRPGDIPSLYHK